MKSRLSMKQKKEEESDIQKTSNQKEEGRIHGKRLTEEEKKVDLDEFKKMAEVLEKEFTIPKDLNLIDSYPIYTDFVFSSIHILESESEKESIYFVNEPKMDEYENKVSKDIMNKLAYTIMGSLEEGRITPVLLKKSIDKIIDDFRIELDKNGYLRVLYYVYRNSIFYERLTPLMYDSNIEDISCNGYSKPIYVFHREYMNLKTNVKFENSNVLDGFVIKLAQQSGKHISIADPMIDATMPDGSRIQMTLGKEVTDHGSTFTIRKFRQEPLTPINLIKWGTFSPEQMAYLWLCIENKKSLIFAGGTASGKTTSTNAIALFIPRKAKIVTIEDTRELTLPHKNWIPGITRDTFSKAGKSVDMYDLLKAALRQRPEYIIVGEVRGKEALTLFQAMSTGHTTYSTLHADTVNGVIHRLENPPINVPRPMIESLDIVSIQAQTYLKDKRVRRNIEIAEITNLDPHTRMLRTSTVFQWDSINDEHAMVGNSEALSSIRKSRGWSTSELEDELERRRYLLEYMANNDITTFKEVSSIIYTYQSNPEKAINMLGIEHEL